MYCQAKLGLLDFEEEAPGYSQPTPAQVGDKEKERFCSYMSLHRFIASIAASWTFGSTLARANPQWALPALFPLGYLKRLAVTLVPIVFGVKLTIY